MLFLWEFVHQLFIPVELVSVPVPLDGVELVPLHVVPAPELGVLAADGVGRDLNVVQLDAQARTWMKKKKKLNLLSFCVKMLV